MTKTKTPAKTVDRWDVTSAQMRDWRISEVRAALETAGVPYPRDIHFVALWEVARVKRRNENNIDLADFDAEARGIVAHAACLNPYHENNTSKEYRYLYDHAADYIQRRTKEGMDVSVSVVKIWKELRLSLVPRKDGL